jgi:heptosyltransferase-2
MDPLPKLFVTPEENQYAMALLKTPTSKKNRKTVMISLLGSEELKHIH